MYVNLIYIYMIATTATEGFISFRSHRVWYRIIKPEVAELDKVPLLCLHGERGVPHDYLEPLELIATTGRTVIFYDQLGCGNSDVETVHKGISESEWVIFENSSHMPHLEETERFLEVLSGFLDRVEQKKMNPIICQG